MSCSIQILKPTRHLPIPIRATSAASRPLDVKKKHLKSIVCSNQNVYGRNICFFLRIAKDRSRTKLCYGSCFVFVEIACTQCHHQPLPRLPVICMPKVAFENHLPEVSKKRTSDLMALFSPEEVEVVYGIVSRLWRGIS